MNVGEETHSQTGLTEASSLLAADRIVCVNSSFVPRFLCCLKANDQMGVVEGCDRKVEGREESITMGVSECECEERG